jgi:hypothetical protein
MDDKEEFITLKTRKFYDEDDLKTYLFQFGSNVIFYVYAPKDEVGQPLDFDPIIGTDAVDDPFWWFRAGRSMYIKQFQTLSKTKILLGIDELEINRIAVSISPFYYKCFIYVETKGEKQIGLYNFTKEDIEQLQMVSATMSLAIPKRDPEKL